MPQVGEKRSDGKVWSGDDFGWQFPATIWKKQPPGKVGDTRTLPGLGTKVYTGTDYGWQLQSTIDKKKQPPPAAPGPQGPQAAAPGPQGPQAAPPKPRPRPVPVKSRRQQELDAINADKTLSPREKWEKANPGLAAAQREREAIRGTSETDNPLMTGLRSAMPSPSTALDPKAFKADLAKSKIKPSAYSSLLDNPRRMKFTDSYDLVLDYLLSEGHADTVDEAHYVMMQLDSEYIRSIVEQQDTILPAEAAFNKSTPEQRAAYKKKYGYPYPPPDTSRRAGGGSDQAPAWMRGGFQSPDEYNKLDPKTKALLEY